MSAKSCLGEWNAAPQQQGLPPAAVGQTDPSPPPELSPFRRPHPIRHIVRDSDGLPRRSTTYVPVSTTVHRGRFRSTLLHYAAALGYDALNITHPCKELVVEHLDRVAEQAARLGAVNTVLFSGGATTGYNTDQRGFATALATELPGAAKDVVGQLLRRRRRSS
jgi:hypothetical protein